jgi:hypothetical protein
MGAACCGQPGLPAVALGCVAGYVERDDVAGDRQLRRFLEGCGQRVGVVVGVPHHALGAGGRRHGEGEKGDEEEQATGHFGS